MAGTRGGQRSVDKGRNREGGPCAPYARHELMSGAEGRPMQPPNWSSVKHSFGDIVVATEREICSRSSS